MKDLTVADLPLSDTRRAMLESLSSDQDIRWAGVHSIAWMEKRGLIEQTGPLQHAITDLGTIVLRVCQEHGYSIGRYALSTRWGTRLDCRCRWGTRTNESQSQGGAAEVRGRHREHVFAALTEALAAAA